MALAGVGENFHNHVLAPLIYQTHGKLPQAHFNLSEAALFYRSDPGWVGPDMQMAFVHKVPQTGDDDTTQVVFLPGVVRPMSRGTIRLGSADPLMPPLIDPNYLGTSVDRERLIQGMVMADRIATSRAMAPYIATRVLPPPEIRPEPQFAEWAPSLADSYHHQTGSCRMGLDDMAVVDPQLRVRGVRNLRVADASVMPIVPSGNCHAAIVMIAEKAADLVKASHGLQTTAPLPAGKPVAHPVEHTT